MFDYPDFMEVKKIGELLIASFSFKNIANEEPAELFRRGVVCLTVYNGQKDVILNLEGVKELTQPAIDAIRFLQRSMAIWSGRLVLCGMEKNIDGIVKAKKCFYICEDELSALKLFEQ